MIEPEIKYWDNGNPRYKKYFLQGNFHREDGPAYQAWFKNGQIFIEWFFQYGKSHNVNGPAEIEWYEDGTISFKSYYINGIMIKSEWFTQLGRDIDKDFTNEAIRNLIINIHGGEIWNL